MLAQGLFKNMERKRNPIVFLDVSVGDEPDERMIFEVCLLLLFLKSVFRW